MYVKEKFVSKPDDPTKKKMIFLVTSSQSADDISKGSEELKGTGVVMSAIG